MHCCKDCKWYFCDKDIADEIGKHECFGHYLICSPLVLVRSIENINECSVFEERIRHMTRDELEKEWVSTYTYANDDKYNAVVESMYNDIMKAFTGKDYK